MTTERMISAVQAVTDKHKNDFVATCQTNITSMCRDIIPKLELLAAYEQIGTVEECQEALERQKAEKPRKKTKWYKNKNHDLYTDKYYCPHCGELFLLADEKGFYGGTMTDYCSDCGQAIDWSNTI